MTTHIRNPPVVDRLRHFIFEVNLTSELSDEHTFNELALEVFAFQFENNPVYRRFCEGRGVRPGAPIGWRDIPAIPTTAFKEFEVTCLPREERTHYFCSSGTTGHEPGRHFHSDDSLRLYEASLYRWFQHNVIPDNPRSKNPRLLSLTPRAVEVPHSSLAHMFNTVSDRLNHEEVFAGRVSPTGAWDLRQEQIIEALEEATSGGYPLFLLGTAFSFVQLLDFLRAGSLRFDLRIGSRILETGGYKGRSRVMMREDLHEMMTKTLGVPQSGIFSEYGMSELSSQAYDHSFWLTGTRAQNRSRVFRFPPWARVQIVSPETGEEVAPGKTGLVRVFDLANLYSAMAVQTEDLGVRREQGFELVGRAAMAEPRGCSLLVNT